MAAVRYLVFFGATTIVGGSCLHHTTTNHKPNTGQLQAGGCLAMVRASTGECAVSGASNYLLFCHSAAGPLVRFSAYSLLVYLNDGFEGGATTFLKETGPRSRSGLTPAAPCRGAGLGSAPPKLLPPPPPSGEPTSPEDRTASSTVAPATSLATEVSSGETAAEATKFSSGKDASWSESGYQINATVSPRRGGILVFPHGRRAGAWPDPLHEGSVVSLASFFESCSSLLHPSPSTL